MSRCRECPFIVRFFGCVQLPPQGGPASRTASLPVAGRRDCAQLQSPVAPYRGDALDAALRAPAPAPPCAAAASPAPRASTGSGMRAPSPLGAPPAARPATPTSVDADPRAPPAHTRIYPPPAAPAAVRLLMEWAPGGDLGSLLQKLAARRRAAGEPGALLMGEPAARFYTACLLEALRFLHSHRLLHRDVGHRQRSLGGRWGTARRPPPELLRACQARPHAVRPPALTPARRSSPATCWWRRTGAPSWATWASWWRWTRTG
jgi:serine/threonine protein kinase